MRVYYTITDPPHETFPTTLPYGQTVALTHSKLPYACARQYVILDSKHMCAAI